MTRVSTRYVVPLAVCLLLVLIPVAMHSYFQTNRDDCANPSAIVPVDHPAGSRDAFLHTRFQSPQFMEGSFLSKEGRFNYSIIRSYDPKRLYHRPENSLVEHAVVTRRAIEWVPTDAGAVPIHRAYYDEEDQALVVAYLLVFRSSPVASPYWPHLRAAFSELFTGSHPMTLYFIQARGLPESVPEMEKVEREWLVSSWEKYRTACTYRLPRDLETRR
jgi:hypothetical protein